MADYDKRKKSIYITSPLEAALGAMPEGVKLTGRLSVIADRYTEILERTKVEEKFNQEEWGTIRDALHGVINEPAAMIRGLEVQVRDFLMDTSHEKDGILRGGDELLETLRTLTYTEEVAVVEAVEQYWRSQSPQGQA